MSLDGHQEGSSSVDVYLVGRLGCETPMVGLVGARLGASSTGYRLLACGFGLASCDVGELGAGLGLALGYCRQIGVRFSIDLAFGMLAAGYEV